MSSTGSFNIAIVGAGGISNAHAAAVKASEGRLKLVGVVDPVEAARKKFAETHGCAAFADAPSLFSRASELQLHGVVLCTPPAVRASIIEAALQAKVAILSEKPLGHTATEALKIADMAKANSSVFTATAYCHRFTPAVLEMKRLVEKGRIGNLVRFENAFACDLPGHETKWMSDKSFAGGGAFIDMGCHSLDLFHFMVGESSVKGAVYNFKWAGRAESAATVLVRHVGAMKPNIEPGVAGTIISGWAETSRFTVGLVGTAGTLFYDYERPTELVFKDLLGKAEVSSIESHEVRFARQLDAFAQSVRSGTNKGLATFADGLLANRAVEAATRLADSW